MEENDKYKADTREVDILFSKAIKAGKRIYYLDVRKNKKDELFLAITESKKVNVVDDQTTSVQFQKHKIFLYKEDFDKFVDGLLESIEYIRANNTVNFAPQEHESTGIIEPIVEEINVKVDY